MKISYFLFIIVVPIFSLLKFLFALLSSFFSSNKFLLHILCSQHLYIVQEIICFLLLFLRFFPLCQCISNVKSFKQICRLALFKSDVILYISSYRIVFFLLSTRYTSDDTWIDDDQLFRLSCRQATHIRRTNDKVTSYALVLCLP